MTHSLVIEVRQRHPINFVRMEQAPFGSFLVYTNHVHLLLISNKNSYTRRDFKYKWRSDQVEISKERIIPDKHLFRRLGWEKLIIVLCHLLKWAWKIKRIIYTWIYLVLTLIIPGYFQNNLSHLNPLKIQHFNGFCKLFLYRGLDMYIKG